MSNQQRTTTRTALALAAVGGMLLASSPARAAVTGQWDFENGTLAATVGGNPMEYADGVGGGTQQRTQFGTTTALGIPDIAGQPGKVLRFDTFGPGEGYTLPTPAAANGGGSLVNQWTLIMDLYYPPASDKKFRALIEIDPTIAADADLFVNTANGIGISGAYSGVVSTSQWHRVAFTVDQSAGVNKISKFIDGALVGTQNAGGLEGRWALTPGYWAYLFTDDDGDVAPGYVSSIQLRDNVLSPGQIATLGGAKATGIPQALPSVPSVVAKWIPSTTNARADTDVGVVIDNGDAAVSNFTLTLDGTAKTPTVTPDGTKTTVKVAAPGFTLLSDHRVIVSYTDSVAGARSFTNDFRVPLAFEDFDGLTLLPSKDDAASDAAWTHEPPAGWSIDNSQFVATIINAENPDGDGDGYADNDGITEFAGWSFVNKDWWVAKDNQTRDQFALGQNIVATADPDEWDDTAHAVSLFNSFLKMPEVPLAGVAANTLVLKFASSWRPEGFDDANTSKFPVGPGDVAINNQTAIVRVSFDGAAPVEVLRYDSKDGGPYFKPDAQNEQITLPLNNPAGATKVVVYFDMVEAANDWWWAIDNVVLDAGATPPLISQHPANVEVVAGQPASMTVAATGGAPFTYQWYMVKAGSNVAVAGATDATLSLAATKLTDNGMYLAEVRNAAGATFSRAARLTVLPGPTATTHFSEDFESLVLGPNVDETLAGEAVWTKTAPAGWSIDDTGVPGVGTDQDGVTEWAGWSFAKREWWAEAGGNQRRVEFTKGTGTVAIADSDEWDDVGHAAGDMRTLMTTKEFDVATAPAGTAYLKFNSSWRPEDPQKANITVKYDGGAEVEVLRFESINSSPYFKDDSSVNDTLVIPLNNPAGAKKAVLTFGYFDTRNNWWWAVDNLMVVSEAGGGTGGEVKLTASKAGSQVKIEWTGTGTLQGATGVGAGADWADVVGAVSGHTVNADGAARFYRVRQ
jgi:hypothetical protein